MPSASSRSRAVAAALTSLSLLCALLTTQAKADGSNTKRLTVDVAPVYIFSTNSDANASLPVPSGYVGAGYTHDNPTVKTLRIDYGLDYALNSRTHIFYSHSNAAYQLGRILIAPNTALVTGSVFDYTDSLGASYAAGHGLGLHLSYFNHQRSDVTGLCLNQKVCVNAAGQKYDNPLSIDSYGYEFGATHSFGPMTNIGQLFTAAVNFDYYPRPSSPPAGAALGGLPSWVGSTWEIPFSLTMQVPIGRTSTFIPTVTYIDLPVLYHDSAVPEAYRGFVWGITKVVDKNVTLSYSNFILKSCTCIERVPPPDNLRLTWGEFKFDFHIPI